MQALTQGSPIGPIAFLAHLNPAIGIYTCIEPPSDGRLPLIGQMQYAAGDRSARISFLMPDEGLQQPTLPALLEQMAYEAGSWGAMHLLAEVEENSCAMEGMRRAGFSVYAWQRIWKSVSAGDQNQDSRLFSANGKNKSAYWSPATSVDEIMIRNLFQSLVPPLVQSAEPLTSRRLMGWAYRQDGEILAYVEGIYGPTGIYLQPLIHPAVENVSQVLTDLLARQRNPLGRPVYIAIRSYQAWLETVVRDLECQVGPRLALMVKHLVVQLRVLQSARHSMLEKYTTETTVPLVHNANMLPK